jgi:hypothetical protein
MRFNFPTLHLVVMNGLLFDNTLNHMVTKILYQNTHNYKWPFRMLIILLLIVCMLFILVFVILN